METEPPIDTQVVPGGWQVIPPGVPHRLVLQGPAMVAIDFLTKPQRKEVE